MAPEPATLRTARLVLRQWSDADRDPFAAMNSDRRVMEHFPALLSRAESDALADRIEADLAARGWGLWAVEVVGVSPFAGFVGLNTADAVLGYPAVEIGWRLAAGHWGRGYATEAAATVLSYGFAELGLDEIVSFTTRPNQRSRRVMEKIGLRHQPTRDFDHPRLLDWEHRRFVLYALDRATWLATWRGRGGGVPPGPWGPSPAGRG